MGVPGTSMASFDYLSRKDRMALAHFVQSLGAFPHEAGSPQALESLSKELATPGERTPNKIPVSMAMAKLEQEFTTAWPLTIAPEDHSPGAEIFRRVVCVPSRAAQILTVSEKWRESPAELAASVLPDAPGNGFAVSAATLNAEEWKQLHAELIKLTKR